MSDKSYESVPGPSSFATFEAVRMQMRAFVSDRAWEPFHTPTNVLLALSGESGELCEIFQWMGRIAVLRPADTAKVVHIGEEVTDVILYTTRLADLCGINLSRAASLALEHPEHDPVGLSDMGSALSCAEFQAWDDVDIDGYQQAAKQCMGHCRKIVDNSPRTLLYHIQAAVGKVCSRFWRYTEEESAAGLDRWRPADKAVIALALGRLVLSICVLCNEVGISLTQVVADKYAKNVAKYPKDLARGSSDKYTAYTKAKSANKSDEYDRSVKSSRVMYAVTIASVLFVATKYLRQA